VTPRTLACWLWLALSCTGACREAPRSLVLTPNDRRIGCTGLFDRRDPTALRFAWPGSRVEIAFESSWLRARLEDRPVEDETRELDSIDVSLDDGPPREFGLAEGIHLYPLASGLPPGPHRISIGKRTEPEVGIIALRGFEISPLGSYRIAPPVPTRALLFVGDSVTAGYGNLGTDGSCHASAEREDNFQTYAAFAARELSASYAALAWSGRGVTRNYEARDKELLPDVFDRAIPTELDSPREDLRPADAIVVNLGTNDYFLGVPARDEFVRSYLALLERLRAKQPSAVFVLVLGPMLADDFPQPRARAILREWLHAIAARRSASGDKRVELLEQWIDAKEGVGCDFHPNVVTHARLGHELAQRLRARLGW
jgi:lysophospholipase L1-like esterase